MIATPPRRRQSPMLWVLIAAFILWIGGGIILKVATVRPAAPVAREYPQRPEGLVADYAGILVSGEIAQLEATVKEINAKTTCRVAIATIKSTDGLRLSDYCAGLFKAWQLGQSGRDNGVLILLTTSPFGEIAAEVGTGLNPIISSDRIRIYIEEVMRSVKEGAYGPALLTLTDTLSNRIQAKYDPANPPAPLPPPPRPDYVRAWLLYMAGPIGVLTVVTLKKMGFFVAHCPMCRHYMEIDYKCVEPPTTESKGVGVCTRTCPACGHHDAKKYPIPRLHGVSASAYEVMAKLYPAPFADRARQIANQVHLPEEKAREGERH